ncbi:DNA repair protein RecO [Alcanivorax hongdengensis A-11-3]|uniref:DNA repair protein RecO n=1 Tax=Alcanivorax hongdengensis A-11-3 TaxID=1177179 RepID=L0WAC1_9GAMM|nr:DNA repair protein RecO [Alcanivorax hongdengensis]EKF73934.1 DNA repair protein RecO [Alcanivorax hongdengensis A-11-3]
MTSRADASLTPAWLLHRRPFRNTSLTVELFTPDHGRIGAVVRGGRRDPLMAPFVPLWAGLRRSGELYTVTQSEPREGRPRLAGKALYCGFYVNEVLTRVLHRDDPQPALWPLYETTLATLSEPLPLDVILRRFELGLLEQMGYGIALDRDALGQPLAAQACYRLDPEQGLLPAADGYLGADLLAVHHGEWNAPARRAALQLCRHLLAPHLGSRPLKSRELFRENRN